MGLAIGVFVSVVALAIATAYDRRRDRTPVSSEEASRTGRVRLGALAGLTLAAPLSPAWFIAAEDALLPVRRPGPSTTGTFDDLDLGWGPWLAIALVVFLYVVLPPTIGAGWAGWRWRKNPLPSGRAAFALTTVVASLVLAGSLVGIIRGGYAQRDLHSYGALTPDAGVSRSELARLDLGPPGSWVAIESGAPLASDLVHHHGSDCCGALAHPPYDAPAFGLLASVAGRPIVIDARGGSPVMHAVETARAPRAGAAAFEAPPRWARWRGGFVFVDARSDRRTFAVVTDAAAVARPVSVSEVRAILAPPAWPLAVLAVFALVALGLVRAAPPALEPHARYASATLLVHGTILALAATHLVA